ncbi:hypothetical protein, partial [Citrobacter freundii]|uniref:hypothetical protein n=1 Tax=Citrobacter freundii TaxID=546 RepID=UPI001A91AD0D
QLFGRSRLSLGQNIKARSHQSGFFVPVVYLSALGVALRAATLCCASSQPCCLAPSGFHR